MDRRRDGNDLRKTRGFGPVAFAAAIVLAPVLMFAAVFFADLNVLRPTSPRIRLQARALEGARGALGKRALDAFTSRDSLAGLLRDEPALRACVARVEGSDCAHGKEIPLSSPSLSSLAVRRPLDAWGRACPADAPVDTCPFVLEPTFRAACAPSDAACPEAANVIFSARIRLREGAPPVLERRMGRPLVASVAIDTRALESILYETARSFEAALPAPGEGIPGGVPSSLRTRGAGMVMPRSLLDTRGLPGALPPLQPSLAPAPALAPTFPATPAAPKR